MARSRETPQPRRGQSPTPPLRDSKSALLEAAQAAVAHRGMRAQRHPPVPRGRESGGRRALRHVLGLVLLFGSGLLVARPAWLAGPRLPRESEAVRAASATLQLIEAVSRVQAFQLAHGRLPGTLSEAGPTDPALHYQRLGDDRFLVSTRAGDSTIVLRSTDSLRQAVVDAIRVLQRRS